MANPGDAASKLLLGTGIGLLLIAGFGLIEQRMSVDEIGFGWLFVLLGLIFIGLGKTLDNNSGPLSQAFPHETAEQLAMRVRDDINSSIKDASVGSAWAELEASVLEQELSQEE